jgi:hypothetical protein
MLTYSELEREELEYEGNAQFDSISERFAGEDGSAAFNRSEYQSYLDEQAWLHGNGGIQAGPEEIANADILYGNSPAGIAAAKKYFDDNPDVPF